jgi:hypothetical protein
VGVTGGEEEEPKAAEKGEGHRRQRPADGREQDPNSHLAVRACRAPMAQLGSGEQERGRQLSGRSRSADDDNEGLDSNINVKQQRNVNTATSRHVSKSKRQHGNMSTRGRQRRLGRGPKVNGDLGTRGRHVRRTYASRCQGRRSSRTKLEMFEL